MPSEALVRLAGAFEGKRVLVTGAGGFVGANLVRVLLAGGCRVEALQRPSGSSWRLAGLENPWLTRHEVDVADRRQLTAVFAQVQPEVVFHLAVPRGHDERARDEMMRVNVLGAHEMMRVVRAHGTGRLIVAGSMLEHGPSDAALGEDHPTRPNTWHGATKAAATLLYQQGGGEGLPVTVLRLAHVYGPWESAHRFAPTVIRAALEDRPVVLTRELARRDWVHVHDVCEALLLAGLRQGHGDVYNIGTGIETSNEELLEHVAAATGRAVRVAARTLAPRITDARHRHADRSRAEQVLGWVPRLSLSEGLRQTVRWYLENAAAWSQAGDVRPEVV